MGAAFVAALPLLFGAAMTSPAHAATSFDLSPGRSAQATGTSTFADGVAAVTFTRSTKVGGPLTVASVVRSSAAGGYRGKLRIADDGSTRVMISRVVNGTQTELGSTALSLRVAVGQQVRVATSVTGTSPVSVKARAWIVGQTVPAWQLSVADSAASRVTKAGANAVFAYLSSTATSSTSVPYSDVQATSADVSREVPGSYSLNRTITSSAITESSGLARSTYDSTLLWTHNDSGGTNRVYGIRADGTTKAVLTLNGANAWDWEDISSGPGHTLWVGDIGDNAFTRSAIQVYRFTEPSSAVTGSVTATKYTFVYADGASHNAETLMVHPVSGRVYVVTKQKSGAAIYAAPTTLSTTSTNRLTKVASAPVLMTAGAFAPDGNSFTLRSQTRSYTYSGFGATPVEQALPSTRQGESLEYDTTLNHVYLGSEGGSSPVYRMVLPS